VQYISEIKKRNPVHGLARVFHAIYILHYRRGSIVWREEDLIIQVQTTRTARLLEAARAVEKRRFVRKRIQLPKTTMGSPDNAIGPNTPEANRASTPPKNLSYTCAVIMAEIQ